MALAYSTLFVGLGNLFSLDSLSSVREQCPSSIWSYCGIRPEITENRRRRNDISLFVYQVDLMPSIVSVSGLAAQIPS